MMNVLIVEDEPEIAQLLAKGLRGALLWLARARRRAIARRGSPGLSSTS